MLRIYFRIHLRLVSEQTFILLGFPPYRTGAIADKSKYKWTGVESIPCTFHAWWSLELRDLYSRTAK